MHEPATNNQLALMGLANVGLENHHFSASEQLARQTLADDPKNSTALNVLTGVLSFTGRQDQAVRLLREMIEIQHTNLYAYYNLASLLYDARQLEEALLILNRIFPKTNSNTPGLVETLSCAYTLCERVQCELAAKNHQAACEAVEAFRTSIELLTGFPVVIHLADLSDAMGAFTYTALQSGRHEHLIYCNRSVPSTVQQHLITHELMHIQLEAEAHRAGKAKTFTTTPANKQFMLGLCRLERPQLRRLQKHGWSDEQIFRAASSKAQNLLLNLFNSPLDLIVETRVRHQMPMLSAAQFMASGGLQAKAPDPTEILNQPDIMPRNLLRIGLALNCVRGRLHDFLFGDSTAFASVYEDTEVFPLASKLWDTWQARASSLGPGDEFHLVDDFADILGLRQAYEWSTNFTPPRSRPLHHSPLPAI
jgi:hypothetical protein